VDGNVKLSGETKGEDTAGAVVPVSETLAAGTLLSMLRVPVKVPAVVGAHVRFTVQVAPGARVVRQLLACVKLGSPVMEMVLMINGPKPELEMPTEEAMLCPGEIDPNAMEFDERVREGAVGAGAAPVTARVYEFSEVA
jgi:hypothetical protein